MQRRALHFTAPRQVAWRRETIAAPSFGQVLVKTVISAISPGTEILIYRGQAPQDLARDDAIAALRAEGPTQIHGAEAAAVSFPEFFDYLDELAIR